MISTMEAPDRRIGQDASREIQLIAGATSQSLRIDHLKAMTSDIGIWQHARGWQPDTRHGYSIDDEARGLIVALGHLRNGEGTEFAQRLARTCFAFLRDAAVIDGPNKGRFHNFRDENGHWLDAVGSEDSHGRTLWALGVAYAAGHPCAPRAEVEALIRPALRATDTLGHLRSRAFAILGLAAHGLEKSRLHALASSLANAYVATADSDWCWFENHMTYCNARLPHALFIASETFPQEERFLKIAVESLDFLLAVTRSGKNSYAPIGNAPMERGGWYNRGDVHPPLFDQQPVDAGALVECCAAAYRATAEPRFRKAAWDAYGWYFGENVLGLAVYDPATGAVGDALTRDGVSANSGAESVLSIHMAAQALSTIS